MNKLTEEQFDKTFGRPTKGKNNRKYRRQCRAYNEGRKLHGLPLVDFEEKATVKYGHIIPIFALISADKAILDQS
jgi:hypothetical protein